ncbi:MAG: ATP-dependent DNA ligase [Candidatus Thermoplasmatota archaeon]|nr:ATP-dependent DNA ligase [Candidatus Thermoplasmatota archaeon]MCL5731545.1 ATP-dependent DNA ligase [Candidatus Thermoplasmatota archaeon]
MEATSKRLELTDMLSKLLSKAGEDTEMLVYLVQGKIAPDYEGIELGMSEKLIAKALVSITSMDEKEIARMMARSGDMGTVSQEVIAERVQSTLEKQDITVKRVFNALTEIAQTSGEGSVTKKLALYKDLVLNGTPVEAKYITRIITGKMRLGVSDATIITALVAAFSYEGDPAEIENAYNCHPDMGYIAGLLRKGLTDKIREASPQPLVPVKVMLAERLTSVDEILEKLGGTCAAEYKYDGLRTQIHFDGKTVKIFSRGTEETTSNFPDIVRAFTETFHCKSCILDGESVPYNPETGELYPFQMVSQRRGRKYDLEGKLHEIPIVVFLFDILYLDGSSLLAVPYPERRKKLESLFTENDHFKPATRIVSSNAHEIMEFFERSISDGCEGIVAKSVGADSYYRAGARGWQWIKFKRDYQKELSDSLDLVVLGAFSGHGRRKGTYGALLMGVYDHRRDIFETVCKLGTGFTDDVLFNLPKILADYRSPNKPNNVNSILEPDVWFYPSIVLEVRGAEITVSPVHTCAFSSVVSGSGLSLRFPRFTGNFRKDKKGDQCTTTEEVLSMFNNQKKKGA